MMTQNDARQPEPDAPADEPQQEGKHAVTHDASGITWTNVVSESSTFSFEAQQVLGRAVVDPAFRDLLFRQPEAALVGLIIPEADRGHVLGVDRRLFTSVVEGLKLELARAVAELHAEEARVVALAKAWEAEILAIWPDDDDEPEAPESFDESDTQ
jgi:hypothetical protein